MPDTSAIFTEAIEEHVRVIQALHSQQPVLERIATKMSRAILDGHKILWCGNGGSAADSQHLAAELVGRFLKERPALPSIALTTNTSILTAIGNDYGYERVFIRQVEAIGQAGDVFMGISTSGNSPNVLRALELCRAMGIATIGLTGRAGGKMAPLCDYCIRIPSDVTMYIQQAHLALEHIFCLMVECHYFAGEETNVIQQASEAYE